MHGFRRVLCGGDASPARSGKVAHVASHGLMQKEIDFIEQMSGTGDYPPLARFLEQSGIIGVTDFEVVESTDLPGWDGSPNPVILSNPHWLLDGHLVPVPPDFVIDDRTAVALSSIRSRRNHRSWRRR